MLEKDNVADNVMEINHFESNFIHSPQSKGWVQKEDGFSSERTPGMMWNQVFQEDAKVEYIIIFHDLCGNIQI